jgi:hypothetical protein
MDSETARLFRMRLIYTIRKKLNEGSLADFAEFRLANIEQAVDGGMLESDADILFYEAIEGAVRSMP